jgi:electron transport complex protein RnfB
LLNIANKHDFVESLLFGAGSAIGFSLVLVLFAGIRERVEGRRRADPFPGRRDCHGHRRPDEPGVHGLRRAGQVSMIITLAIMALGAVVLGAALGYASIKFKVEGNPLVEKIEAILPQTQCGQCGYPGCKPYAGHFAGEADINLCPPGGMEGVRKLADLLGREVKPLEVEEKPKQVAIIDEATCIGCTLCIQACPVDAIVGAAKQMHTIIESLCTGCELCIKPCPVECIHMQPITENLDNWKWKYPVIEIKRAA